MSEASPTSPSISGEALEPNVPTCVENSEQRYQAIATEHFAALGRYVQAFESMVDTVRSGVSFLLGGGELAGIVVHTQVFSALPLMMTYRAMLAAIMRIERESFAAWDEHLVKNLLSHLQNCFSDAANKRNSLLHGTWHIGARTQGEEIDSFDLLMYKGKISATGLRFEEVVKNIEDLNCLSQENLRLQRLIQEINAACTFTLMGVGRERGLGLIQNRVRLDGSHWVSSETIWS